MTTYRKSQFWPIVVHFGPFWSKNSSIIHGLGIILLSSLSHIITKFHVQTGLRFPRKSGTDGYTDTRQTNFEKYYSDDDDDE